MNNFKAGVVTFGKNGSVEGLTYVRNNQTERKPMIVREIKDDPINVLKTFDHFNDYDDTRSYVFRYGDLCILDLLDASHAVWSKKKHLEHLVLKYERSPLRQINNHSLKMK